MEKGQGLEVEEEVVEVAEVEVEEVVEVEVEVVEQVDLLVASFNKNLSAGLGCKHGSTHQANIYAHK